MFFITNESKLATQVIYWFITCIAFESIIPKKDAIPIGIKLKNNVSIPNDNMTNVSGITTIFATKNNTGNWLK